MCEEEGDIKVSFMHPKGPGRPENCFFWTSRGDICYIPENDILGKISAPIPSKSARKYKIPPFDTKATCEIIESRITNRRKQVRILIKTLAWLRLKSINRENPTFIFTFSSLSMYFHFHFQHS